ncbi:MAG: flagellar secretion chaperone FliS [Campylobacterota bacterium]|nr:flagellar secretion chaperone FliS [Campylobacterota bacterium]MDQ1268123.1 flagellar secretion chaperone FliS [Campylobacterota bacterium]MDQ1338495.1 flagellar secretion chaperone FliS [Campylobacterota bacterium]
MNEENKNSKKGSKMYGNAAHNIYAQNNVGIESPAKLIEMLYEGVLRFNAQAKKAFKDGNIEKRVYWINRSIAVITELITVLDMKGGRVAHYLEGLYNYEIQLLNEANAKKDESKIDEVSNVFKGLLEAWRETTNVAK